MNEPLNAKRGLLAGLVRVLHLHQLPQPAAPGKETPRNAQQPPLLPGEIAPISTNENSSNSTIMAIPARPPVSGKTSPVVRAPIAPLPTRTTRAVVHPAAGVSSAGNTSPTSWPASAQNALTHPVHAGKGVIITDYDRILDLVRMHTTIKLDEIARILSMKEELVAQELQTLEDNGLVEVKYPAFGEPLIYFKQPEE